MPFAIGRSKFALLNCLQAKLQNHVLWKAHMKRAGVDESCRLERRELRIQRIPQFYLCRS